MIELELKRYDNQLRYTTYSALQTEIRAGLEDFIVYQNTPELSLIFNDIVRDKLVETFSENKK